MSEVLAGQTAVITGAASGIGREVAVHFAEQGAGVVVADQREKPREGGPTTVERIEAETSAVARYVACDVREREGLERAATAAASMGRLGTWVNNAGLLIQTPFLETSAAEFERMMDINVKGCFLGAQVAAERLVANGGGSIINLSSVSGLEGTGDRVAYCASKGAVRLLTYALADALGEAGVRVNAIHPGAIATAQAREDSGILSEPGYLEGVPLGRFGDPAEVAAAAVYLASEAASYVTGESLVVDGGRFSSG